MGSNKTAAILLNLNLFYCFLNCILLLDLNVAVEVGMGTCGTHLTGDSTC